MVKRTKVGDYILSDSLGAGGFASVVLGRCISTKATHAVKVYDLAKGTDQFLDELNVLETLRNAGGHPNLVKYMASFRTPKSLYIALEFVDGESVEQIIQKPGGKVDYETSLRWLQGVSCGVHYLSSNFIAHRDIRPPNLMVSRRGKDLKVIDFNISRVWDKSGMRTKCGRAEYLVPEMLRAPYRYGPSIDLWGIGITAFELFAGGLPFEGSSHEEVWRKIARLERRGPCDGPGEELVCGLLQYESNRWGFDKVERWLAKESATQAARLSSAASEPEAEGQIKTGKEPETEVRNVSFAATMASETPGLDFSNLELPCDGREAKGADTAAVRDWVQGSEQSEGAPPSQLESPTFPVEEATEPIAKTAEMKKELMPATGPGEDSPPTQVSASVDIRSDLGVKPEEKPEATGSSWLEWLWATCCGPRQAWVH